jgi:hypothetical protein
MPRYLFAIEQPDGPPPADIDLDAIMGELDALIAEAKARGAWVFNGGLLPPHSATVVRVHDGELVITDGPYVEAKEHIGGVLIVETADLDGALSWARRMAQIIGLPIEIRPFHDDAPG